MKTKMQPRIYLKIKSLKKDQIFKAIKIFFLFFLTLIGLIIFAFHLAYWKKIYPGIAVGGLPVGNKTISETVAQLKKKLANNSQKTITLVYQERKWEFDLEKINFSYNLEANAKKAFSIGRNGKPIEDLKTKIQAWKSGINLGIEYQFDQNLLENQIATISSQILIPAIEPQIKIVDQKIEIEQGKEGQELDKRKLIAQINTHLTENNFLPIELPVNHFSPLLNPQQLAEINQRASKFLNQKLNFVFQDQHWELNTPELMNFILISGGFNQEKIANQTADLAKVVDRLPQNALFRFESGRVTEFRPEANGIVLNQKETQNLIQKTLQEIESQSPLGTVTSVPEKTIVLPVIEQPPEVTADQINNLGIKELLGKGISYFKNSPASRIHNLTLASSRLNGLLIAPDEEFSFNQSLGEVTQGTGYEPALIIKEGRTVPGDGGGVCQVSTTLFRAILNSGLPIIERHPHAYRVGYYEQGGFGPGLDATVWQPGVDLKFKNDTRSYILIQSAVEPTTATLDFELYGTSDGRQATVSKPKIWEQTPPAPDLYQDDPTLPVGTVKQIEKAIWGAKVSVDWLVIRNGEILQKQTIYSKYAPWQAVYLKGTKT